MGAHPMHYASDCLKSSFLRYAAKTFRSGRQKRSYRKTRKRLKASASTFERLSARRLIAEETAKRAAGGKSSEGRVKREDF